ncbi:hypothetical protein [Methanosarcina mazei]|jgi:hypothetical protein|nr:hypothetical protein [Methanosarcina mazei]
MIVNPKQQVLCGGIYGKRTKRSWLTAKEGCKAKIRKMDVLRSVKTRERL